MKMTSRRHAVSFDPFYFERKMAAAESFSMRETFEHISAVNLWGSAESVSGEGSTAAETQNLGDFLYETIVKYDCSTLLDAPCGDYAWLSTLVLSLIHI